jgi:hypothetical protein
MLPENSLDGFAVKEQETIIRSSHQIGVISNMRDHGKK